MRKECTCPQNGGNSPETCPTHTCPFCKARISSQCRCARSDMTCPNGHAWHTCTVHKKLVVGESDHSQPMYKCSCKSNALGEFHPCQCGGKCQCGGTCRKNPALGEMSNANKIRTAGLALSALTSLVIVGECDDCNTSLPKPPLLSRKQLSGTGAVAYGIMVYASVKDKPWLKYAIRAAALAHVWLLGYSVVVLKKVCPMCAITAAGCFLALSQDLRN